VTNTLPIADDRRFDGLEVLSIAPLIARAIREVFEDGSVTSLFDGARPSQSCGDQAVLTRSPSAAGVPELLDQPAISPRSSGSCDCPGSRGRGHDDAGEDGGGAAELHGRRCLVEHHRGHGERSGGLREQQDARQRSRQPGAASW
jgi:hypothetical protein